MAFITLDNKDWCKGIYHQGKLHFEELPKSLKHTWKYASYLSDRNILYASLYTGGKSIDEVCPPNLLEEWTLLKKRLKAFHNSFLKSKINLEENCFFELVPEQFLLELCESKAKIVDHVFEIYQKPEYYDLFLEIEKCLMEISLKNLNIELDFLKKEMHNSRARSFLSKIQKSRPIIDYNLFGSKTGRLTVKKDAFPILNLDTKYRKIIKPTNDLFVELDYNAAELRTLLALSGMEQPRGDIHDWNAKRLNLSRDDAKQQIFSWLYGSTKVDSNKFKEFFNLNKIMSEFYDGSTITNLYKRKIKSDQFHSLNYLIQSTTSDLVLEQFTKISNLLKNKKSFVSFLVHDSIVIDLAKEDRELVEIMMKTFSKTRLGDFPVNLSMGKDYGDLRKILC